MLSGKTRPLRYHLLIFVVLCLLFFPTTQAAELATVHGAVYDWETFKLLENAIVEVNSTPPQSQVAKYGLYSFNLPMGTYSLSASYYEKGELVYYAEEELNITDGGDYILDMLLLPVYPNGNLNTTPSNETTPFPEDTSNSTFLLAAAGFLLIAAAIVLLVLKKKHILNNTSIDDTLYEVDYSDTELSDYSGASLPHDLQQVVKIIKANGGRITQRELRNKIHYSEAKVSLMISDLENRGIIEKFKKGRGNIIVLKQEEHQNI